MAKKVGRKARRQRKRTVLLTALKVSADPHPKGIYETLFKAAVDKAKPVKMTGDRHARLWELFEVEGVLVGHFRTYLRIDRNKDVLDLKARKVYTEGEKQNLLSERLDGAGVNGKAFMFAFSPKTKLLVYERSQVSPHRLADVFEKIFNSIKVQAGVDNVSFTVVQDESALERILAMQLQTLAITLKRPNPDDLASLAEEIREELEKLNAESEIRTYDSVEGEALKPDARTKALSTVALEYGEVTGRGLDPATRKMVTRTTATSPMMIPQVYDPKLETAQGFLARAVETVSVKVAENRENATTDGGSTRRRGS